MSNNPKIISLALNNDLERSQKSLQNSLEKLSSGKRFTSSDPKPADRALSTNLESKVRSLNSSRNNINNAISFLQIADDGMAQINDHIVRMKELNIEAATSTLSDKERNFLFIEYDALRKDIARIVETTDFNNIKPLNGEANEQVGDDLIFRIGDPYIVDGDDINMVSFKDFKDTNLLPESLQLPDVEDYLDYEDGIELDDAEDFLEPDDDDFSTIYDEAIYKIAEARSTFGAIQVRVQNASNYNEVMAENLSAANSRISDTDYASEVTNMVAEKIRTQVITSLMAMNNRDGSEILNLLE